MVNILNKAYNSIQQGLFYYYHEKLYEKQIREKRAKKAKEIERFLDRGRLIFLKLILVGDVKSKDQKIALFRNRVKSQLMTINLQFEKKLEKIDDDDMPSNNRMSNVKRKTNTSTV
jgi:hypothetical protein